MKRSAVLLTVLGVLLYLGAVPLFAQHGPGGGHGAGASGLHGMSGSSRGGGRDTLGPSHSAETSSQKQLTNVIKSSTSSSPSKMSQKLMSMLPTTGPNAGLTLQAASQGFKNLGRFIAALHAYNNLGLASQNPPISFSTFASKVNSSSLGKAIKTYRPDTNTTAEIKKATKEAHDDITEGGTRS